MLVLGAIKLAGADAQMRFAIDAARLENVPIDVWGSKITSNSAGHPVLPAERRMTSAG